MRFLWIQLICFFLFISFYATHYVWLANYEKLIRVPGSRCFVHLVSAIYKPYTFWVIYSFVKEIRRNGNMDGIVKKLSDEVAEECYRAPETSSCLLLQTDMNAEIDLHQLTGIKFHKLLLQLVA